MDVKNWKEYLRLDEENTPVSPDNEVDQELTQRSTDLTQVKQDVTNITNVANGFAAMNDSEQITSKVEETINQYANNKDSYITLALSYLKTMGDKKNIELKLLKYQQEIPALQTEMKSKIDQLNSEIAELHNSSTTEINV